MVSVKRKLKRLTQITTGLMALAVLSGCLVQNPFNPRAELRILEIKPDREVTKTVQGIPFKFNVIGIFQSFNQPEGLKNIIVEYEFVEPVITITNKNGLPKVTFDKGFVAYEFEGETLPRREFPFFATIGGAGESSETLQIRLLRTDNSLKAFIFPGNSPSPSNETGVAQLTLEGTDFNNNPIQMDFQVPMRFETTGLLLRETSESPSPAPASLGGSN